MAVHVAIGIQRFDELIAFTRSLFNSTFKTNPWLERGIMTGITRGSKESIFSDLNNLKVVTTTSDEYEKKEEVKRWYDGFIFGKHTDIYNPWSILNFLDSGDFTTYWANTSSNNLVGKLVREGNRKVKEKFETLLRGETIWTPIDEQIVYNQLDHNEDAVFSLLLASGYLKAPSYDRMELLAPGQEQMYELALTNYEVERMFEGMVQDRYRITSNRENSLEETVQSALEQIEDKKYEGDLIAKGIPAEHIHKYGFAFEGKQVLIG